MRWLRVNYFVFLFYCIDVCVYNILSLSILEERRKELVEMLNINLNWRMNELSDGQRRRVQILVGLIRPFQVLLLDEITTSLDVCVRQDLLKWLVKESDQRGATIIYATHIFDGLDDWATHLFYLTNKGNCGWQGKPGDLELYRKLKVRSDRVEYYTHACLSNCIIFYCKVEFISHNNPLLF